MAFNLRAQHVLTFSLVLLMLGLSASAGLAGGGDSSESFLLVEPVERQTHSTVNESGFSSDSIYTNTTITAGSFNGCAILENRSMTCWGANWFGQLGDGSQNNSNVPVYVNVTANETPVEVSAGTSTACAVMESGKVYCWGSGAYGKMGDGQPYNDWTNSEMKQASLPAGASAETVSIAHDHICTVLDDGDVYCWGRNDYGQLGNGGLADRNTPQKVNLPAGSRAVSVSTGDYMTCAITDDGMGYCWGENDDGQLGNGTTTSRELNPVEVLFPTGRTPVSISAGERHACALMDNGKVMCWGDNTDGRLGRGPLSSGETTPVFVSMASGETAHFLDVGYVSACMILDSGDTRCWGTNTDGQIGTGTTVPTSHPNPTDVSGNHEFVALSVSGDTVCAVNSDAEGYCWGESYWGQAGRGTNNTDEPTPAQITLSSNHLSLDDRDPDDDGILSIFDTFPYGCIAGSWFNAAIGDCQWATPGHYTDEAWMESEIPCPVGSYQPDSGQSSCLLAPAGYYTDVEATVEAIPCPAGEYQPSEGQTECLLNDAGHFSLGGAAEQTPCLKGMYQPQTGQSECIEASPGYFVDERGSPSQTPCSPGTYSPTIMAHACTEASQGHHVPNSASTDQTECPAGTYSDEVGLATCKEASPGHYTDLTGRVNEEACPPGQYQPAYGQTSCEDASPGHHVASQGSAEQTECARGYYQSETGSDRCITSKPGFFVDQTGATEQTPCPAGSFQSQYVRSECIEAAEGNYVAEPASSFQTKCPLGNYSESRGATECTQASPGHYVNNEGSSVQTPCGNGTYQPDSGQTSCLFAQEGHYVDHPGATAQTPCPPGTYQTLIGMLSCIDTDPGHHTPEAGMTEQVICPAGTYQPEAGRDECLAADPGHYVLISGMTQQTICGVGWYQPDAGQSECLKSDPGFYAPEEGTANQIACAVGTYQNREGATDCKTADVDHYVPVVGAAAQTPCETGSSQPLTGQGECVWPPREDSLPIIPIVGGVVVLLAIVGFVLMRRGGSDGTAEDEQIDYSDDEYEYEEEATGWERPDQEHFDYGQD